jgi:membrane protein YqaA with SNARE-associated domain
MEAPFYAARPFPARTQSSRATWRAGVRSAGPGRLDRRLAVGYGARVAGPLPPNRIAARRPFERLERLARGWAGAWLLFGWGVAEAFAFPVVPDVLLCLLALVVPGRAARLFLAMVAGALVGSAALYVLALADPAAAERLLLAVPGITPAMLDSARAAVAGGSPLALALVGPGIPLKVYTFAWAGGPATPVALAAGIVVNRLTRIGPDVAAAYVVGRLAPDWLRRHDRVVLVAYGAAWLLVYLLYLR